MSEPVQAKLVAQTWSRPFEPPESIPVSADVVIIGGGIVGVSTAWFLTRQGVNVVLCEKGHIAGEQSGRNWGWVRQQGRDAREMPMMIESLNIWRTLADEIGENVGFRQTGCLYAARDEAQLERYAAWLGTAEEFGVDSRVISGEEIARIAPGAAITWKGGLYTTSDGCAEPHKAVPALARAARLRGATLLTACAVRGLETEAGRVSAVVIEESDAIPGFHIATGLSGHGFGIGPGVGKATAGMLTGNDSGIDLSEFRLGRFFDGSKIRLNVSN